MRAEHYGRNRLRGALHLLSTVLLASLAHLAYAESDYADTWGPSVGTMAPLLAANDQAGNPQNLESLAGDNGLLFIFNRSVDW